MLLSSIIDDHAQNTFHEQNSTIKSSIRPNRSQYDFTHTVRQYVFTGSTKAMDRSVLGSHDSNRFQFDFVDVNQKVLLIRSGCELKPRSRNTRNSC